MKCLLLATDVGCRLLLLIWSRQGLQLEPVDEGRSLLHYLVPRSLEGRLVDFLPQFEGRCRELGVTDLQCNLASLEEVFLTIARRVSHNLAYLRVV